MIRTLATALGAVLLAGMLAACGGGDGDPTPTQTAAPAQPATATATTAAPTATVEPSPTATASPTPEPTRTPAPAPVRLIPTATPPPSPTPTPTPEPDATAAQLLGFAALNEDDLGGDWTLDSTEVPELSPEDSTAICGQPRFADRDQRVAALQLEFSSDGLPALLTQDLHVFPYSTAFDAMDYAREIAGACTEWTDEDGILFQISPLEDPVLGDESFAVLVAFSTPEGAPLEAYIIFVREDEYLMSLTYITLAGGDTSPVLGIAQTATAKVFGVSEWFFHNEYDANFLAQSGARLLTTPEMTGGWTLMEHAISSSSDRYGVCDAPAFPDEFLARSEITGRYRVDLDLGPYLAHSIVALYSEADAADAMAFIRDTSTCVEWTDDLGDYYVVLDRPSSEFGDESYAIVVEVGLEDVGPLQIVTLYIRTGSIVSVLFYAEAGSVDLGQVQELALTALAKLGR